LKCPLEFHEAYVKILRIASGYRDPEKLAVTFTHNYIELWLTGKVSEEMFIAYLPVKAIKSAHRFDPGVYTEFFSGGSREKSTASDSPPTPQQSPPQA
jgi:hypothetical protein